MILVYGQIMNAELKPGQNKYTILPLGVFYPETQSKRNLTIVSVYSDNHRILPENPCY